MSHIQVLGEIQLKSIDSKNIELQLDSGKDQNLICVRIASDQLPKLLTGNSVRGAAMVPEKFSKNNDEQLSFCNETSEDLDFTRDKRYAEILLEWIERALSNLSCEFEYGTSEAILPRVNCVVGNLQTVLLNLLQHEYETPEKCKAGIVRWMKKEAGEEE